MHIYVLYPNRGWVIPTNLSYAETLQKFFMGANKLKIYNALGLKVSSSTSFLHLIHNWT